MKKSVGKKQNKKELLQLLDLPFGIKSGYFSSNSNILHFKGSFQSLKRSKNAKILWVLCIL
jgi:hypothetical protein